MFISHYNGHGIKLVRPLSTVDNTRDYARVSHSRQWSNYNLLTMIERLSNINVTVRLLYIQFLFFARWELNQLSRSVRSILQQQTGCANRCSCANSLIAPRACCATHPSVLITCTPTTVVHTSRSGSPSQPFADIPGTEKSIRCGINWALRAFVRSAT